MAGAFLAAGLVDFFGASFFACLAAGLTTGGLLTAFGDAVFSGAAVAASRRFGGALCGYRFLGWCRSGIGYRGCDSLPFLLTSNWRGHGRNCSSSRSCLGAPPSFRRRGRRWRWRSQRLQEFKNFGARAQTAIQQQHVYVMRNLGILGQLGCDKEFRHLRQRIFCWACLHLVKKFLSFWITPCCRAVTERNRIISGRASDNSFQVREGVAASLLFKRFASSLALSSRSPHDSMRSLRGISLRMSATSLSLSRAVRKYMTAGAGSGVYPSSFICWRVFTS